ncbi:hypothetical protein AAKU55_000839 [Oxalobacteraceae bacterium GrIS 1.11]
MLAKKEIFMSESIDQPRRRAAISRQQIIITMHTRPFYLALLLLSCHTFAQAQYIKCKDANGHTSFQNTPCAADPGAPERKRPTPGEKDDSLAQRKKDNRPDPNWEVHAPIAPQIGNGNRLSPPQAQTPAYPTQAAPVTAAGASWQEKNREYQNRRVEHEQEETKAYNQQVKAHNQMLNCNLARQQLGVVKDGRAVYSHDNKGDRHYLDDDKRAAEISTAQQRVAKECQ